MYMIDNRQRKIIIIFHENSVEEKYIKYLVFSVYSDRLKQKCISFIVYFLFFSFF